MFETLQSAISSTVKSATSLVGGRQDTATLSPRTVRPPVPPTNDAHRMRRPHSPAATSHDTAASIDLTSPARRRNQAHSLDPKTTTSSTTPYSLSDNKTTTKHPSKPKATPLPDPRYHFLNPSKGMGKPGASHNYKPQNTLNQATYQPAKQYGRSHPRNHYSNFLDSSDDQVSAEVRPSKKRKVAEELPHAIEVYDEGDAPEVRSEHPTPRPTSRRSGGSGSLSLSGPRESRSEFGKTATLTDPRRKKSRASTSNGNSGFFSGGTQSQAITVDDDDIPDPGVNPRTAQLLHFQQGIGQARGKPTKPEETTSPYFAGKMSHSTRPSGTARQRTANKTASLPNSSSRKDPSERGPWPLRFVRAHDFREANQDLFLSSRAPNEFRITSSDRNDIKYENSFNAVNQALKDKECRIRLMGSLNTTNGVLFTVDMEFQEQQDLVEFTVDLSKSITVRKIALKDVTWMTKIFQKPLASTYQPIGPVMSPTGHTQAPSASSVAEHPRLLSNLQSGNTDSAASDLSTKGALQAEAALRRSERPARTTRAAQPLDLDLDASQGEEEPEIDRYSVIYGLGRPWKKPLEYGSGRSRAVVNFLDLERLDDGEFLNDNLIDFYLIYLFDKMGVPPGKVYLFNTHFFTTLTAKKPGQKGTINYDGVKRWTTKEDIFGYDYIVVPINQDIHWYLAIICNVSNIARKPAFEDLTKSDGVRLEIPDSEDSARLEAKMEDSLVDQSSKLPALISTPERVDSNDSDLNLVDPRASASDQDLPTSSGANRATKSPASETAQMKRLSLNDCRPDGILLDSTPSASSIKPKRRLGPPPRKVDPNEPVVIVLDSLGGGARSRAVKALKEYITAEGDEKRGMLADIPQNAFYAKKSQIPQQQNFSDCGIYLLGYAQKFFENPDAFKTELLTGQMNSTDDWPDMAMSTMREKMREILQNLAKEQEAERKKQEVEKKKMKEEKQRVSSGVAPTTVQPQPRLASPFAPRATQKRSRSRSRSLSPSVAATPKPCVTEAQGHGPQAARSRHGSPPRRSRSPIVLVPSPARDSPKRQHGSSSEEMVKKKLRTALPPEEFLQGRPQIVGIHSPSPRASNSKHRNKTPPQEPKGSHRDPIPLVDSQDTPGLANAALHGETRVSSSPELTVVSPKPKTSTARTALPPRRMHPYQSSPVRSRPRASPAQTAGRAARSSPDPLQHGLNVSSPRATALSPRRRRPVWVSVNLRDELEDDVEKSVEVPETPPHETES